MELLNKHSILQTMPGGFPTDDETRAILLQEGFETREDGTLLSPDHRCDDWELLHQFDGRLPTRQVLLLDNGERIYWHSAMHQPHAWFEHKRHLSNVPSRLGEVLRTA